MKQKAFILTIAALLLLFAACFESRDEGKQKKGAETTVSKYSESSEYSESSTASPGTTVTSADLTDCTTTEKNDESPGSETGEITPDPGWTDFH